MTGFDPVRAADLLQVNRAARRPAGPLPDEVAPRSEEDAAAVQAVLAQQRGHLPVGGFKIGATGRRMQELLGVDHPCAGYMAATDIHRAPAALRYDDFRAPLVECELAIRLASDLPPTATDREIAAAVGEVFAAIEIVENRYGPPPVGDIGGIGLPTVIADQFYHAAAVIGAGVADWRDLDLRTIEGRTLVDGQVRNSGRGEELLGDPLRGLGWLAGSSLAAAFGGLRAGQVVLLGSVTPPIAIDGACAIAVAFDRLPPVQLRFV